MRKPKHSPRTQSEMVDYLGYIAVQLANAATMFASVGYKQCETHLQILDAYKGVMRTKRWHEEAASNEVSHA